MTEQGQVRTPHPALRPYVGTYAGYHLRLDPRAVHHGLPSLRSTVIVSFDEPLDVGWAAQPTESEPLWTLAAGLHVQAALVHTHGLQHGIQLDLTPAGSRALLGLPVGEIARQVVGHDQLPLGIDAATHEALANETTWARRFDLLEAALLALLPDAPPTAERAEVDEAWRIIERTRGLVSIDRVARQVGWSRRTLTSRFATEFGVGPKQAARISRFGRAHRLLSAGVRPADVAATCGYADQAHLTRDWRALAGRPPVETVNDPFSIPNVQDAPASRPAGSST